MLVPNSAKSRIEYVIKTYRDSKKNRRIILDTIEISLALMGRDAAAGRFAVDFDPLWQYLNFTKKEPLPFTKQALVEWYELRSRLESRTFPGVTAEQHTALMGDPERIVTESMDRLSADVESVVGPGAYTQRHPLDFVIPWIARELGRLSKAEHRGEATGRDMEAARDALMSKAPAIGMWAKQENVDLNRTSLADALEAVADFEVDVEVDEATQGVVVYAFDDGWTIQALQTQQALNFEGEAMQHCVAGYCEEVGQGRAYIYSLRDPRGKPHVTIEWRPDYKAQVWRDEIQRLYKQGLRHDEVYNVVLQDPVKFIDSGFTKHGSFAQIRGKQNEMPAEKYRERVQQFIHNKFHGNALGLLMVALPGQRIDLSGQRIQDVDFTETWAWEGVDLSLADFTNAEFEDVTFDNIRGGIFDGARFINCSFDGDALTDCLFRDASFHSTRFIGTLYLECSFAKAKFVESRLLPDKLMQCDFSRSEWDISSWTETEFFKCSLANVKFRYGLINRVQFEETDMAGIQIDADTEVRHIIAMDVDLTGLDEVTTRLIRQAEYKSSFREVRW